MSVGYRFLIAQDIGYDSCKCLTSPCPFSDHDSVNLSFQLSEINSHGPGVWCLNSSLLSDPVYLTAITTLISQYAKYAESFPSQREGWDLFKQAMKERSEQFAMEKQKSPNFLCVSTNKLIREKQKVIDGDLTAPNRVRSLKSELNTLCKLAIEGNKTRSRAQWLEEGEKPTRYFCNLEKHRVSKNSLSSLLDENDKEVSSQEDLEQVNRRFYQKLYSKSVNDQALQTPLIESLPSSLSDEDQLCDGKIRSDKSSHGRIRGKRFRVVGFRNNRVAIK